MVKKGLRQRGWSPNRHDETVPLVLPRDIYSGHLKNSEEFEGGLEKRKGKGGKKKEKSDKTHVKIP